MLREEHICNYCDSEYTIESDVEEIAAFCPFCGNELDFNDEFEDIDDEDLDEED